MVTGKKGKETCEGLTSVALFFFLFLEVDRTDLISFNRSSDLYTISYWPWNSPFYYRVATHLS